jgi:hypothetical protein
VSCNTGYQIDENGNCIIDYSGEDCVPTGTPDPNATYKTNTSNVCTFLECNAGYELGEDGVTCRMIGRKNCEGEWRDTWVSSTGKSLECAFGCGSEIRNETYIITAEAVNGGDPCPHLAGEKRTSDCGHPPCPVIDTTETIDGVEYQVKYNENTYQVHTNDYHGTNNLFWGGVNKDLSGESWGGNEQIHIGNDRHRYFRGEKQLTFDRLGLITTKYAVKRSVIEYSDGSDTTGKCIQNPFTSYLATHEGLYQDENCNHTCTRKLSENECLASDKFCNYKESKIGGYFTRSYKLSDGCRWVKEGGDDYQTMPLWMTEYCSVLQGTVLKTVPAYVQQDGSNFYVPAQSYWEVVAKNTKFCRVKCAEDPACVGFGIDDGQAFDYKNKCVLYSEVTGSCSNPNPSDGQNRGFLIERRYVSSPEEDAKNLDDYVKRAAAGGPRIYGIDIDSHRVYP